MSDLNGTVLETGNVKLNIKHVVLQARYAAKYSIDMAANLSRMEMEDMAKDRFSMQRKWAGEKSDAGFRARNSVLYGEQSKDLVNKDGLTLLAGAYSGDKAFWTVKQEQGGSASQWTPAYDKSGGKINKAGGGNNTKFNIAGGVREVFGKQGKAKSRGGMKKLVELSKTGGKGNVKIIRKKTKSGAEVMFRLNVSIFQKMRKAHGDNKRAWNEAADILFVKSKSGRFTTKKNTNYKSIFWKHANFVPRAFNERFISNLNKSISKRLK